MSKPLRMCGMCHTWNSKPCGEQCGWSPTDPVHIPVPAQPTTDSVLLPRKLTAENGAKAALIGEFKETVYIADEDGEEHPMDVPVSWDTIKRIWDAAVEHFAAQPPAAAGETLPDWKQDQAETSRLPRKPVQRSSAGNADALRLLAAEDERQSKLHELLETIREQIRLEVAPEHRPEGLFKNIQDAVYAMRGRTRLMDDAAITHAIQSRIADGRTDSPSPAIASPVAPSRDEERGRTFNEPQRSVASEHPISQGMLRTQEIMCAADMEAKIAALAHRFWSIHPSSLDDMGLTREEFYAREMKKLLIPIEPQRGQEPIARAHITLADDGPYTRLEVLNGEALQPSMSPVDLYVRPTKQVPAYEIAMTLAISYGRDPDEPAPILEMCDENNQPVPIWMVYVEQAEALLATYSVSRPKHQTGEA